MDAITVRGAVLRACESLSLLCWFGAIFLMGAMPLVCALVGVVLILIACLLTRADSALADALDEQGCEGLQGE
jgi:hypothetical protein